MCRGPCQCAGLARHTSAPARPRSSAAGLLLPGPRRDIDRPPGQQGPCRCGVVAEARAGLMGGPGRYKFASMMLSSGVSPMITVLGSPRLCCDGLTRRETLKAGALSLLGGFFNL